MTQAQVRNRFGYDPRQSQMVSEGEKPLDYVKRGGSVHIQVGSVATMCGSMIGVATPSDPKTGKRQAIVNCLGCIRASKGTKLPPIFGGKAV